MDLNNNGTIDNKSELFADNIIMSDRKTSDSGYDLLSSYDSNNEDDGYLVKLKELGIIEISLVKTDENPYSRI